MCIEAVNWKGLILAVVLWIFTNKKRLPHKSVRLRVALHPLCGLSCELPIELPIVFRCLVKFLGGVFPHLKAQIISQRRRTRVSTKAAETAKRCQ